MKKRLKLVDLVQRENYEILLLTETWLTENIKNGELFLPNFNIIRADRPGKDNVSSHGGVLIAISNEIQHEEVDISQLSEATKNSCRAVLLDINNPVLLVLLYNPPNGSPYRLTAQDIEHLLAFIETKSRNIDVFFAGDLNMPNTNWETYESTDTYDDYLLGKAVELGWKQIINFNTTRSQCLDVVLTNRESMICYAMANNTMANFSDHTPVSIEIALNTRTQFRNRGKYYSYCKCDFEGMAALMKKNHFKPYCYSNVDVNTDLWYEWLFEHIEMFTPKRTKRRQNLPPWTSQETSHQLNRLNTLKKKAERRNDENLNYKVTTLENTCMQLQEEDRSAYESHLFASRDRNRIFKYLKSLQSDALPPKMTCGGNATACTDSEKAELFNDYFSSVVTDENYVFFYPPKDHKFGTGDLLICEDEIQEELKKLNATKSRGADTIPPSLLKNLWNVVSKSITSLFSTIKRLKKFPSKWKNGIVTPIFKDGNRSEISNYRPVTLLNIISKILEKLIFRVLMKLFCKLVNSSQFGFLPRKSVVIQLLYSLSLIYENLSANNDLNILILFDFSKAFDKIKHNIMLMKLLDLDVSENLFMLIRDYLTGRSQQVRVNDEISNPRQITSGVPQGSVLGPLLFLIYINDLPDSVFSSAALLFADDLKLIHRAENANLDKLQEDLTSLHAWSMQNCLLFNSKKCSVTEFVVAPNQKSRNEIALRLGEEILEQRCTVRDVGLIISDRMKWTEHIDLRLAKALISLFLLKRNTSSVLPVDSKIHLFRAIISTSLFYASECWEPNRGDVHKLERFNKRVLKWICGNDNYKNSILQTNILPPMYFKVLKDLLMYHNILNNHYDVNFAEYQRTTGDGRRRRAVLPEIQYETQRQNFWYRTGFRINVLQRVINFFETSQLKSKLLAIMWNYFEKYWTSNNPCTWTFICLCQNCRANPLM